MKEFFIQCMKDLEPLTGIRQLFFMQSDIEDGQRKFDVLIKGMVSKAAEFDYIPEAVQKAIIKKMMVKDQEYDQLNSRVIDKWLNLHKDQYFTSKPEELKPVQLTEEQAMRVDALITEALKNLAPDPRSVFKGWEKEAENIKAEDNERQSGNKAASLQYKMDEGKILERELHLRWIRENVDPLTGELNPGGVDEKTWLKNFRIQ